MAKNCLICEKKIGALSKRLTIKDGCICLDCAEQYGVSHALSEGITYQDVGAIFAATPLSEIDEAAGRLWSLIGMWESFEPTYSVGGYAFFDDGHRTLMITRNPGFTAVGSYKGRMLFKGYTLLRYDDIVGYDLLEDGESQSKGGLGRAVVGGALFGPAGAVVGGITGKRKSNNVCNSLKLKLTLRDKANPSFYLPLITSGTKTESIVYRSAMDAAQDIISKLQAIDAEKQEGECLPTEGARFREVATRDLVDPVEELRRYKALLDEGILTEQEYVAKKKQILGI